MTYKIKLEKRAREDLQFWRKNDPKTLIKITKLIENITKTPFEGLGKPEPLKENLSGYWSRRINYRDRLVYKVENNIIYIIQARFHY